VSALSALPRRSEATSLRDGGTRAGSFDFEILWREL
jgi:hypothetical protein